MNRIKTFIINSIAGRELVLGRVRVKIYNLIGMDIKTSTFYSNCHFSGSNLSVGKNSWINYNCTFENHLEDVSIGENCAVAMGVLFCTSSHKIGGDYRRGGKTYYEPIRIDDGCWIGAGAKILPGVTIGKGCIIAAGAVVTKNCEPNGMYGGVPARRIKDLPSVGIN